MTERGFDDSFWGDPFVQDLPKDGKLLYLYLWTNKHCNQAGLYEITPKTIAFETGLNEADILELFDKLKPKVIFHPDKNLVWVKNFIKRQTKSPKFLIAVAKSLMLIHSKEAIEDLLTYNQERYTISIPYPYGINNIAIPSISDLICSNAVSSTVPKKEERDYKGEGEDNPKSDKKAKEIWEKCLKEIKTQVNRSNFSSYYVGTVGLLIEAGVFIIGVPREDGGAYLMEHQRSLIERTLIGVTSKSLGVGYRIIKKEQDV